MYNDHCCWSCLKCIEVLNTNFNNTPSKVNLQNELSKYFLLGSFSLQLFVICRIWLQLIDPWLWQSAHHHRNFHTLNLILLFLILWYFDKGACPVSSGVRLGNQVGVNSAWRRSPVELFTKKEGGGLTHKFVSLCSKLARNTVIGQMPKTLPEYWFYLKKKNKPLSIKTNCGSERLQNHEKVKAEIIDAWINGWAGYLQVYFGIIKMVTEFIFRQYDRILNYPHVFVTRNLCFVNHN